MPMRTCWARVVAACLFAATAALTTTAATAADEEGKAIEFGKYSMQAPKDWEQKQPTVRIIAYEFAAPAADGDATDGRLTVMGAGGTIDQNVQRWYGQFTQPDGSNTADKAKVDKKAIAGQTVHTVDISGTYKDQRGPFAPAVERENYRMLGAIVETKEGNVFFKFYGPQKTIAKHADAFWAMINSLK